MIEEPVKIEVRRKKVSRKEEVDFISTCFSNSRVIWNKETLHPYLLDKTVSNNWWDLTDAQRKALGLKIINDFAPKIVGGARGDCGCVGTNIKWGVTECECGAIADIIRTKLNRGGLWHSCWYYASSFIPPDTWADIHCYTEEEFYLPCCTVYILKEEGLLHAFNTLQIGIDETDFDSWLFFDCMGRCKIVGVGRWQLRRGKTITISSYDQPLVVFDIPLSGKPIYQGIKKPLPSAPKGKTLLDKSEIPKVIYLETHATFSIFTENTGNVKAKYKAHLFFADVDVSKEYTFTSDWSETISPKESTKLDVEVLLPKDAIPTDKEEVIYAIKVILEAK